MQRNPSDRLARMRFWSLPALGIMVSARIALATCGDGIIDLGEACDDGNLLVGDCCSPTCTADPPNSACPDDGNPCSLDVCDGFGVCTHPTGGQAACDDGDPCTIADTCGDGVCVGTAVPESCIDGALCYRTRGETGFARLMVELDDHIVLAAGRVGNPTELCLPARTDGGVLLDPSVTLASFKVRSVGSFLGQSWRVTDQFGALDVDIGPIDRLLVATATSPTDPPPPAPAAGSANQYACRRVRPVRGSAFPSNLAATVDDGLGSHAQVLVRPKRLCHPADIDVPGTGVVRRHVMLLCYSVLGSGTLAPLLAAHTANQLGTGQVEIVTPRAMCVPARAERPVSPCQTAGDECGLPCCRDYAGQQPECTYQPLVTNPRYRGCAGPTILLDRAHVNFHQVTPESRRNPGRFWGFAKLLGRDGYVVRDSLVPFDLLPTTSARIIVVANPRPLAGSEAVSPADAAALVAWVGQGGSLLLSIDHSPFDQTAALLAALGLVGADRDAGEQTFTRAIGSLNGAAAIANGGGPDEVVDEVTTFTGTAFSILASPPPQAQYEPILTFPPDAPAALRGLLQGVAIQFGAGRVYVSGESGGLTAQNRFGMQFTPDNEQFVRNVIHWLDF